MSPYPPVDERPALLTPDEYMTLLVERAREADEQSRAEHGISVDMSSDYCRLAQWRTSDPKQQAKAARREYVPPREQTEGQLDLLEGIA